MKIFGMRMSQIGDIIMSLPLLDYFENKYPASFKYFSVSRRYKQIVPLLLNHPLINEIKVTDLDDAYGESDLHIIKTCDIVIDTLPKHDNMFWYNERTALQETAHMAGVQHQEVTTIPKLYNQFPLETKNYIAVWPFAGYGDLSNRRSPSKQWWDDLFKQFGALKVYHFGSEQEPDLNIGPNNSYLRLTELSFSEQVRISLNSRLILGTDSGSMWCTAAYHQVPQINMLTNWFHNHHTNYLAIAPIGKKSRSLFAENGCDNINHQEVIKAIHEILSLG